MGRRQQQSGNGDLFNLLKTLPSWVGPVLALAAFCVFKFVIPLALPAAEKGKIDTLMLVRPILQMFAWLAPAAVLMAWVFAEIWKLFNRRRLDSQTGIPSINSMSWQQFENLICEAYRRKGYMAEVVGSASGDGGVDVELTGHGQTILVQCKQWRTYKVGVNVVRELLGVVVSEQATKGIVVTSGRFTQEARSFANANPQIELVDGPIHVELIRTVQTSGAMRSTPQAAAPVQRRPQPSPQCPNCGSEMVLRTAKKGPNAGSQFWGCPKYPACRGTLPAAH